MTLFPRPDFGPRCKVCDRGALIPKKMYRMSGPVVAIGYILLVPSVLGMLVSALVLLGVLSYQGGDGSFTNQISSAAPNNYENSFRANCIANAKKAAQEAATPLSEAQLRQYCECSLWGIERGESTEEATKICSEGLRFGVLSPLNANTDRIYSDLEAQGNAEQTNDTGMTWFHIIGGGLAIFWLIGSFVGGLLGWLLVMKKQVLQCNACGATVSAS